MRAVNLALASYGTTQSLQLLRRHAANLRPRVIVYSFINDHLWRNISPCAPSAYPFCYDTSHVAFDDRGAPYIAPPYGDGATRAMLQVRATREGLNPLTWFSHGLDVIAGRVTYALARAQASHIDAVKEEQAFAYLMREMAGTAKASGARLVTVYLPWGAAGAPPIIADLARELDYEYLGRPARRIPVSGE